MKKMFKHGDQKSKSSNISGHMYNPVSGTIDTFIDGEFSHQLCQVHEPKPELARKTFVVGTASKLNLSYNSGPTEWNSGEAVIILPRGK